MRGSACATFKKARDKWWERCKSAFAMDNPRHFGKVQWFAKYWNASLPANATSYRVLGVGL
jgi:hypothetical protein